jgi:Fe-S-cluster containining protein
MKHKILQTIYDIYAEWSSELRVACHQGCSRCCTQNVTITALEAEEILRFIVAQGMSRWFADKLTFGRNHQAPQMTTNDFAKACLAGRDVDPGGYQNLDPCPFLEETKQLCLIYPVRPFGCRLFVSKKRCSPTQPALVPDYYFEGSTAVTQLIEHLGQKEYWGNMLDVLPSLLDANEFREISDHLDSTLIIQARLQTLTAKPLPGFLINADHAEKVTALVESIFSAEIEGKRVEDILNGK